MQSSRLIPLAAMESLMKKAGAPRVSESSKKTLKTLLEEYGANLTKEALLLSSHAKRKTIHSSDLELASKKIKP